jgi:hypothetical protein
MSIQPIEIVYNLMNGYNRIIRMKELLLMKILKLKALLCAVETALIFFSHPVPLHYFIVML